MRSLRVGRLTDPDLVEARALVSHLQSALDRANARIRETEATAATLNGRLAEANERIDTLESAIVRHIGTAQIDAGAVQTGSGLSPYIAGS